jgi:hypothetical protein
MSLRPSYPDVSVGSGFRYVHKGTGHQFSHPILVNLHKLVSDFHSANKFQFSNDEFDDNVCHNTPNIVCTESVRGVGDIVHVVLNPISKAADAIFGTNTQGCAGCYQRQNNLNK